jgi:ANTAR domain
MSTRSPQALAAKVSVALAMQREICGRGIAMTTRTIIGQAQGILMEKLGIDADQAFAYLRRISQSENPKLIMICQEIVNTRRLSNDHLPITTPQTRKPRHAREGFLIRAISSPRPYGVCVLWRWSLSESCR